MGQHTVYTPIHILIHTKGHINIDNSLICMYLGSGEENLEETGNRHRESKENSTHWNKPTSLEL